MPPGGVGGIVNGPNFLAVLDAPYADAERSINEIQYASNPERDDAPAAAAASSHGIRPGAQLAEKRKRLVSCPARTRNLSTPSADGNDVCNMQTRDDASPGEIEGSR